MTDKSLQRREAELFKELQKSSTRLDRRQFFVTAASVSIGSGLIGQALAEEPRGSFRDGVPAQPRAMTLRDLPATGRFRDELVKDLSGLSDLSYKSQGAQWWRFKNYITPNEDFFIRNTYATPRAESDPRVDKRHWRLKIHGNGVERELTISYDDLLKMPSRSIIATMECAGNSRNLFWEQQGMTDGEQKVKGNGWGLGAIGQAEWEYVPIDHILGRVGLKKGAKWALIWSGIDSKKPGSESDTGRPLPVQEFRERGGDIGLCFKMNGVELPPDHGGPVRMLVPGWTGAASIKWVREIKIATHNFWVPLNSFDHVFIGPAYKAPKPQPGDEFRFTKASDIKGPMVDWLKPKSLLTVPMVVSDKKHLPHNYHLNVGERPKLAAGKQSMLGFAWGPRFGVRAVQYRIDGGEWQTATLVPPTLGRYTWSRFRFDWTAEPGTHKLETRTIDNRWNMQPDKETEFNSGGYEFWSVPQFHVDVV